MLIIWASQQRSSGGGSVWILALGTWNDLGGWIDTDTWID